MTKITLTQCKNERQRVFLLITNFCSFLSPLPSPVKRPMWTKPKIDKSVEDPDDTKIPKLDIFMGPFTPKKTNASKT